jgi:prepilin-type N-terminal cleavage/methylation domain-containing protein
MNSLRNRGSGIRKTNNRGFTLVEMIVAVALFAIVMLICVGALLALVSANRKAQALQSVMNNLNISLDDMVRTIRTGSNYRCNTQSEPVAPNYGDCQQGGTMLYITPFGADPTQQSQDIGYVFDTNGTYCGKGQLCKVYGNGTPIAITSSDVTINSMEFYVIGTPRTSTGDTTQPKVVITITGTAGAPGVNAVTSFNIQATAVQRMLDL